MPEIQLKASQESIHDAMLFLRNNLTEEDDSLAYRVELAVEELFMNVIQHAYADESSPQGENKDKVVLGCHWVNMDDHDFFCVWLKDWRAPYDPFRSAPKPDTNLALELREEGGLGVHLVKHVSKHYIYSGADGSNTVELYFQKS